jgi:hypothetical protein
MTGMQVRRPAECKLRCKGVKARRQFEGTSSYLIANCYSAPDQSCRSPTTKCAIDKLFARPGEGLPSFSAPERVACTALHSFHRTIRQCWSLCPPRRTAVSPPLQPGRPAFINRSQGCTFAPRRLSIPVKCCVRRHSKSSTGPPPEVQTLSAATEAKSDLRGITRGSQQRYARSSRRHRPLGSPATSHEGLPAGFP